MKSVCTWLLATLVVCVCACGAGRAQSAGPTTYADGVTSTIEPGLRQIVDIAGITSDPPKAIAADAIEYSEKGANVAPLGNADSDVPIRLKPGQRSELVTFFVDGDHDHFTLTLPGENTRHVSLKPLSTTVWLSDQARYHLGRLLFLGAGLPLGLALLYWFGARHMRSLRPDVQIVRQTQTLVGRVFDGYELTEELGQGAFSHVFKARNLESQEVVAMKVLKSEHIASGTSEALGRFHRESMVQLNHRNVVQVFGCGDYQGRPYIVLELIAGTTLRRMMNGPLPLGQTVTMFLQMCEGLSHAHKRGYVHRDLKPENVMIRDDGVVKLMDFGIAKHIARPGTTRTATTMGTPTYMSPEHVDSSKTDARSDIYSLGVMLFEMLCGRPPFEGDLMELISAHMYQKPPTLVSIDDSIPAPVSDIVARTLEKSQEARYQSVDELADALARCPEVRSGMRS